MTILCLGAGYSALAFAGLQSDATIYGTTRQQERLQLLQKAGITPLLFSADHTEFPAAIAQDITHLIVSIGADKKGDPLLSSYSLPDFPNLEWICYLSTVGVYGDYQGQWIDETAPCRPSESRSIARLMAESQWQDYATQHNIPFTILRLSGIYGPGRNAFIKLDNGIAKNIIKKNQVFNRIHVDDIAAVLSFFSQQKMTGIYNLADDEPAPPQDIIAYAAHLMQIPCPEAIPFDEADLSAMARSFYSDNKRIMNHKLKATGYTLQWPDYRTTLAAMWHQHQWQ